MKKVISFILLTLLLCVPIMLHISNNVSYASAEFMSSGSNISTFFNIETGKNLLADTVMQEGYKLSGTFMPDSRYRYFSYTLKKGTYTISVQETALLIRITDSLGSDILSSNYSKNEETFTINEEETLNFNFRYEDTSEIIGFTSTSSSKIQIEKGNIVTDYEPFKLENTDIVEEFINYAGEECTALHHFDTGLTYNVFNDFMIGYNILANNTALYDSVNVYFSVPIIANGREHYIIIGFYLRYDIANGMKYNIVYSTTNYIYSGFEPINNDIMQGGFVAKSDSYTNFVFRFDNKKLIALLTNDCGYKLANDLVDFDDYLNEFDVSVWSFDLNRTIKVSFDRHFKQSQEDVFPIKSFLDYYNNDDCFFNPLVLPKKSYSMLLRDYSTGYEQGYADGQGNQYDSGYSDGFEVGSSKGYSVGYDEAVSRFSDNATSSVFMPVLNSVASVMKMEIFPNVKLGYILGIPLILGLVFFVLKFFK